jgi:amino acid transporter
LKQAAKNSFRAIYLTMGAMLVLTMAVYLGLYTSVGGDFLAAASYVYNNDSKHWVLAQPNYSYLATIATTNPILQWLISICFTAWYLPLPILSFLFFSRYALAASMDRILPEKIGYVSERTHTPLVAIGIAFVISLASLFVQTIYGVVGAASFAVLAELVGYFLVALAAVFFPYLPKTQQVYRASPARMEVGGVPLISVMGVISCVVLAIMGVQFWADPSYFIAASFWPRVAVVVLPIVAVVIYFVAYYVHKARGEDISLAFKEIPPE